MPTYVIGKLPNKEGSFFRFGPPGKESGSLHLYAQRGMERVLQVESGAVARVTVFDFHSERREVARSCSLKSGDVMVTRARRGILGFFTPVIVFHHMPKAK